MTMTTHEKNPPPPGEGQPGSSDREAFSTGGDEPPTATLPGAGGGSNAAQERALALTDEQILTIAKHHFRADHSTAPETLAAYCESVRAVITAYALDAAPAAPVAIAVPKGFAIKCVEGHGWTIDPPSGSRWVAFEGTPAGELIAALLAQAVVAPVAEYDGNHAQDHCCECGDYEADFRCAEPAPAQAASGLPSWFDTFLTNVCEIPDRNSPEDEPDAIIATLDELQNCALDAIEECAKVCDDLADGWNNTAQGASDGRYDFMAEAGDRCADEICALAASPAPAIPAGDWQPVETAPEGELVVVFWLDPNSAAEQECYDFDMLEDGCWRQWTDHYEWAHSVAPVTEVSCTMPREHPPYTHWKRLGTPTEAAPAISESEDARKTCMCSGLGPCERRTGGSCRITAPADARDAATFIRDVAAQTPEKPDHWSSCGQCQRNAERAQDLLDAACAQSIDLPDSEGGEA